MNEKMWQDDELVQCERVQHFRSVCCCAEHSSVDPEGLKHRGQNLFSSFPQSWWWSVWYRLLAWAAVWRHEVFPMFKLSPKPMPNHKLQAKFQFLGIAQVSALIPTLKNPRGCKTKHVFNIYNTHRASYSSRCFETVTERIY